MSTSPGPEEDDEGDVWAAGQGIWVENCYPPNDKQHWLAAMPQSTRPTYVPATVEECDEDWVTLVTDWEPKQSRTMSKSSLRKRTKERGSIDDIPFEELHEAQVLEQLYKQHMEGRVYDVVGPVLLALNPSPKTVDVDEL